MEQTVVVRVERTFRHKFYGKYVKTSVKYLADDPNNSCNIGDVVLIEECRPLSKRKRWRVKSILEQAV
jgi:small subunit ribosomal protein S17